MKRPTPVFCATIALFATAPAMAQTDQPVSKENTAKRGAAAYWTAERFKAAKPLPLPAAKVGEVKQEAAPPQPTGKPESSDAQAPSVQSKPHELRLYQHEKNSELGG
ncbi:hypothetical protein HHL21_00440 [Massilia sp. RP-1-19]|uniref:DUF4148 domain-containing protein n=1 Tax=Massilia polaris TaxID=2728846 RepID=A0A848HF54_9BURK|nr:hypothetical protein [Massilia polaris]NML59582.1 hypothetical protein [Massilia polaris]